ncbi:hypothetical protein [Sinisalibacter aestuarii]|uniref:HupE/UreJ family protein n=1 Tax=Sinisalibacter aestuarii TaxID=2949426 RepID=A0ABQ5LVH3_9RHOB|nr:hypothetical protein [Sinisalibacter aestuarii]GKY88994.1 hypothetical protein STA1M1_28630 [Sinisalibacter aestuarii]
MPLRLRAGLALALMPQAASAHAIGAGAGQPFGAGLKLALTNPDLLLPMLALAVALALWGARGLRAAWPYLLAGTLIGLAIAPVSGPWIGLTAMGIGLLLAVVAALVPVARLAPALPWLAGMTGLAVVGYALEGHGFGEVSNATRAGLLIGLHGALALAVGAIRMSLATIRYPATAIFWRIAASWIAAILVLYLAFTLRG